MLRLRIITAVILIPLIVLGIIYLSPIAFALVSGVLFLLVASEWAALCHWQSLFSKGSYVCLALGMMLALYFLGYPKLILTLGCVFWLFLLLSILRYRKDKPPFLIATPFLRSVTGIIIIPLAWVALIHLHEIPARKTALFILIILVCSTDIFAYFAGRKWGKTPLVPLISPGKTLAGFWGGLIGSLTLSMVIFALLRTDTSALFCFRPVTIYHLPFWTLTVFLTILLAVIGDLFESLTKRVAGVKDSGRLLPGHGGLLDRFDSLLPSLPFFTLMMMWWCNR